MNEGVLILAERYAKAVLGLAVEASAVDEAGRQFTALAAVCLDDQKSRAFWRSLKVPDEEKRHTLQDILEKMDALALVRNTANLLLDRGRFELLPDLVKAYRRQAQELSHKIEITVVSAVALDESMTSRLRDSLAKMTGKVVELSVDVDPSLLGGVKVRIGNTVIDGSAMGRLSALARSFA